MQHFKNNCTIELITKSPKSSRTLVVATVLVATVSVGLANDGSAQCKHAATPIVCADWCVCLGGEVGALNAGG